MESTSLPGRIQISEETYNYLKNSQVYRLESRGKIKVHGLGIIETWFLSKNDSRAARERYIAEAPLTQDQGMFSDS
jgi:class 3 adenylate cyclase